MAVGSGQRLGNEEHKLALTKEEEKAALAHPSTHYGQQAHAETVKRYRAKVQARASELKQTLFELKNKASTGVLDSTAELTKTRRDVARCLTLAREKQGQAAQAGKKE